MPIQPPLLDDRRYADLAAQMHARIPAHTPEWTQPATGDPGVTLIELFAWLGDALLYRVNLIPERQRLAFLSLVGRQLRAALPATGLVALQIEASSPTAAAELPRGSAVEGPLPFMTLDTLTALPLQGRCFLKRRLSTAEAADSATLLSQLQDLYELPSTPSGYVTHEVFAPLPGGAEPEPIDLAAQSVDNVLWIALCAATPALVETARVVIGSAEGGARRRLNLGLVLAPQLVSLDGSVLDNAISSADPSTGGASAQRLRVAHRWELSTGALDEAGQARFLELEAEEDSTAALTRSGVLRLALPAASQIGVPENDPRRLLKAGVGDNPPRIDDPKIASRLVAWLRLRLTATPAPTRFSLQWAGIQVTRVVQRQALPPRVVGNGDGGSAQSFNLGVTQVDAAALQVDVEDPQTSRSAAWRQVDELGAAGPHDRVYELDAEAGELRFGDGIHGAVPANGMRVRVSHLQVGGGLAGNLPPGSLKLIKLAGQPYKLAQPLATSGGADSETLEAAERRIPAMLRHRDRAVTADDYRDLLAILPRGDVARVEVLPRFKPHERALDVPGVVSVMVWPKTVISVALAATPDYRAPAPRADRLLLEAAHAWLDPRRPLATELYLIGCEYIGIGLAIAVRVRNGHAAEEVLPAVRLALRRHLWATADGGPDGTGWPLGRTVDNRELEVVAARVPGVDGVSDVSLFRNAGTFTAPRWQNVTQDVQDRARITLERWQLPELLALSVLEGDIPASSPDGGEGPAPGGGGGGGAGGGMGAAAAVPLVPDLC